MQLLGKSPICLSSRKRSDSHTVTPLTPSHTHTHALTLADNHTLTLTLVHSHLSHTCTHTRTRTRSHNHSTVLYCTVLHCTVLYCTVLYCTALYCTHTSNHPQRQSHTTSYSSWICLAAIYACCHLHLHLRIFGRWQNESATEKPARVCLLSRAITDLMSNKRSFARALSTAGMSETCYCICHSSHSLTRSC